MGFQGLTALLPLHQNDPPMSTPTDQPRRRFLKTSTQAVAAGSALLAAAPHRFAHASPENPIKIGMIGCGGRGTGAANQALNSGVDVELVAMCDVDPAVLERQQALLSEKKSQQVKVNPDKMFTGFEDYKAVIAESDLVILATPPGFRPLHFEEAVRQGKHVFMEKPVATDVRGIKRVLAAAEEAKRKNLKVGVGLQRRHQPTYEDFVKRLQDGAIGDIMYLRAFWNGSARAGRERLPNETELQYQIRNWYYFTWLSGDHNVEQHVHNLDVVNWIKGEHPVRAQGMGGREVRDKRENGQIFDHHFVEYAYADGTRMWSQCRQIPGCWRSVSESITGTKGEAQLESRRYTITGAYPYEKRLRSGEDGHQLEHYPLFDAIREDKPYNEAQWGAEATMTAIIGRMSTYSGQVVTWEDAMASNQQLVPDDLTSFDSIAPVQPDAEGWYPVAVPGVTQPYELWY